MPIYQIILVIAVVILVLSLLLNLLFSPITWIIIAILVIYSFIRRYLYEKQLKEFREILAQSMTLPKNFKRDVILKAPSKESGQAYRNGSDDVIDVNYVEKDENE